WISPRKYSAPLRRAAVAQKGRGLGRGGSSTFAVASPSGAARARRGARRADKAKREAARSAGRVKRPPLSPAPRVEQDRRQGRGCRKASLEIEIMPRVLPRRLRRAQPQKEDPARLDRGPVYRRQRGGDGAYDRLGADAADEALRDRVLEEVAQRG